MRDNSYGLAELVRILERDGRSFGEVRVTLGDEIRTLELPLTAAARSGFVRVLNVRPFDQMPGQPHRYFFVGSTRRLSSGESAEVGIRVEVGRDAKNVDVVVPVEFASNLVWLANLESWSEVAPFIRDGLTNRRLARARRQVEPGSA
jgi:hypothetical protein